MHKNEITIGELFNDAGDPDGYHWRIGYETGVTDEAGFQAIKAAVRKAIGPPPPERVASPETQAAFLAAAAAMNTFALLAHNDSGVDARLAEGINDRQQWLASCDWPILGYDTSDPPADPTT